jgi:hypothetical protein
LRGVKSWSGKRDCDEARGNQRIQELTVCVTESYFRAQGPDHGFAVL